MFSLYVLTRRRTYVYARIAKSRPWQIASHIRFVRRSVIWAINVVFYVYSLSDVRAAGNIRRVRNDNNYLSSVNNERTKRFSGFSRPPRTHRTDGRRLRADAVDRGRGRPRRTGGGDRRRRRHGRGARRLRSIAGHHRIQLG